VTPVSVDTLNSKKIPLLLKYKDFETFYNQFIADSAFRLLMLNSPLKELIEIIKAMINGKKQNGHLCHRACVMKIGRVQIASQFCKMKIAFFEAVIAWIADFLSRWNSKNQITNGSLFTGRKIIFKLT
jgi:hypothetical protein